MGIGMMFAARANTRSAILAEIRKKASGSHAATMLHTYAKSVRESAKRRRSNDDEIPFVHAHSIKGTAGFCARTKQVSTHGRLLVYKVQGRLLCSHEAEHPLMKTFFQTIYCRFCARTRQRSSFRTYNGFPVHGQVHRRSRMATCP